MSALKLVSATATASRRFAGDASGNMTMIMALAAIPMVATAGLAIDYVRGIRAAGELQQVADGAALAAAAGKHITGTTTERLAKRKTIAVNFLNNELPQVQDIEIVGTPSVNVGPNTVDIGVTAKVRGSLINVLNGISRSAETGGNVGADVASSPSAKVVNLSIHSKIGYSKESYTCLLALDPSVKDAIYFQGNSEFMASCGVIANSNHPTEAIRTWGNAYAEAESFCAKGGWMGSGFYPQPVGGCSTKADPYASMTLPSVPAGCDYTSKKVKNEEVTIEPGSSGVVTLCGGLDVVTHGKAVLKKGLYIIKDGKLAVDSQSELKAEEGVVFYLTGTGTHVDIASGAVVKIKAPTADTAIAATAPYKSFAIMQDRTTSVGSTSTIYSKGGVDITGAVYMPMQNLVVWANGDMNANSPYFPMIVNTLNMNGTATLYVKLDYASAGLPEPVELKSVARVQVSQ